MLLLDKYITKLPPDAKKKDLLYCKLKSTMPVDVTAPWYTALPVGKISL